MGPARSSPIPNLEVSVVMVVMEQRISPRLDPWVLLLPLVAPVLLERLQLQLQLVG